MKTFGTYHRCVRRTDLIQLARKIELERDPEELGRLVAQFDCSVPHPAASDLFFFPELQFGTRVYPGAEAVVDAALSYEDPWADKGCRPPRRGLAATRPRRRGRLR